MEHEPGHDLAEFFGCKHGLVHRVQMRPDRFIVPAAKLHIKSRKPGAHRRCRFTSLFRIIVNMRVVAFDHSLGHGTPPPVKDFTLLLSKSQR